MEQSDVVIRILRSPADGKSEPFFQQYTVDLAGEEINLLQALEKIYETQDDTLAFRRYSCGLQLCNSCMMCINGKNTHACMTVLEPGREYVVEPLAGRPVIRDLIVEA